MSLWLLWALLGVVPATLVALAVVLRMPKENFDLRKQDTRLEAKVDALDKRLYDIENKLLGKTLGG